MFSRLAGGICLAAALLLYWLLILRPPVPATGPSLDASWCSLLDHDFKTGVEAGVGSIFTYGPLGSLVQSSYDPDLYWGKVATDLVTKAAAAVVLVMVTLRLRGLWWRLAYVAALFLLAPASQDALWLLTMGALALGAMREAPGRVSLGVAVFALAGLGLVKFTYLVAAVVATALIAASAALRRSWRGTVCVPLGFGASLVVLWIGLGQPVRNIGPWLGGSFEIARGYNDAMAIPGEWLQVWIGGAAALLLATVLVLWLAAGGEGRWRRLPRIALVGTLLAVSWKAAFVRQDDVHVLLLLASVPVLSFFVVAFSDVAGHRLIPGLAGTAAVVSVAGALHVGRGIEYGPLTAAARIRSTIAGHVHLLGDLPGYRALLGQVRAWKQKEFALQRVKAVVGSATVDNVAHEQGILFLNHLRVHHRPVFQSYSSYTPWLQEVNGAFYRGATAPRFVLLKVQAIDRHPPLMDDARIWLALLRRYQLVLAERGYLLLERKEGGIERLEGRVAHAGAVGLGEWIEFSPRGGRCHLLALQIDYSALGQLARTLFRGPGLFLDLELHGGETVRYRISPPAVAGGFLVDPVVQDTRDFSRLYLGEDLPRVRRARVQAEAGYARFYAASISFELRKADELRPTLAAEQAAELRSRLAGLDRKITLTRPILVEPPHHFWSAAYRGTPVLKVRPPCRLHFRLPAGKVTVRARFGIMAETSGESPKSKGVEFSLLELPATGGPARDLFRRLLDPARTPADRGWQHVELELDPRPDAALVLATSPGPEGSGGKDLAFWSQVEIDRH